MLIPIETLSGFEDCPGYYIDEYGRTYSNRRKPRRPALSDAQIDEVKRRAEGLENPISIAHAMSIDPRTVTQALNYRFGFKEKKPSENPKNGYLYQVLYTVTGKPRGVAVHQLVAFAFLGPAPESNMVVRHLDDDKQNNHRDNLAWGTAEDNRRDLARNRRTRAYQDNRQRTTELLRNRARRSERRHSDMMFLTEQLLSVGAIELHDFPGYFLVFEDGKPEVFSVRSGKVKKLRQYIRNEYGHLVLDLYQNGKKRSKYLHVIVKTTIDGPAPDDKPLVLHRDGNPLNNSLDNLKFGNNVDNVRDAVDHAKKDGFRHYKLDDDDVLQVFDLAATGKFSQKQIADLLGVDRTLIGQILRGKTAARVTVPAATRKRARRTLKPTPKKSESGIADRVRQNFLLDGMTREKLATMEQVSKKTIHQMLTNPDRRDVVETKALQHAIQAKLRNNIGAHCRRFSKNDIDQIRMLSEDGHSMTAIAKTFGVHRISIRQILQGKSYKNV